jgi:hypothetical protein
MAEMIDFQSAMSMLACDDATLQNMIDNGTIRAERVQGKLMLNAEDVKRRSGAGTGSDSDSILVLDSESDDLSIDLGEVVDDGAQTLDMAAAATESTPELEPASGTDSLTFGDELEVVTFDEGRTEELVLQGSPAASGGADDANTENLSFTDSNTAVITDVDETVVGSATATSDYQTVDFEDEEDGGADGVGGKMAPGVRRSVRAQRARQPVAKIHPFFAVVAILCALVNLAVVAPYFVIMSWPNADRTYYNNAQAFGMDDNGWTNLAGSLVGFSIEPNKALFDKNHGGEQYIPITQAFPEEINDFRIEQYRGKTAKEPGDRTR